MPVNKYFKVLLDWYVWLLEKAYGRKPCKKVKFSITTVKIRGITVKGDNMAQTKGTFQDSCLVVAEPRDENNQPSQYEVGTERWAWSAVAPGDEENPNGIDATNDYEVGTKPTEHENNPLAFVLKHKEGVTRESVANITLSADGDPDADEVQDVVGTHTFIVDSPNTVAFEMAGSIVPPAA